MTAFWLVQHEEYKAGDAALAYWGPYATRGEAEADLLALDESVVAIEVPTPFWLDAEAAAAEKADRDRDHLNAETDRLEDEPPTTGDQ